MLLRRCFMARRRFLRPNVWRVTVAASLRLFVLLELFFNRYYFGVSRLLVVFVASGAGRNGDVRRQPTQGRSARNVDVTRSAFHHMLAFTTFMTEFCRDAFGRQQRYKRA